MAGLYAEHDEEALIAEYLDVETPGVYVDVGCGLEDGSNTLWLYEKGWFGLLVDARMECMSFAQERRPRDVFVRAGVEDMDVGHVQFVESGNLTRLVYIGGVEGEERFTVPAITLMKLIELMPQFAEPDLFSLDIEGAEAEALSSCDFRVFRPKLMIIEQKTCGIEDTRTQWYQYVAACYDSLPGNDVNAFFRRKSEAAITALEGHSNG